MVALSWFLLTVICFLCALESTWLVITLKSSSWRAARRECGRESPAGCAASDTWNLSDRVDACG